MGAPAIRGVFEGVDDDGAIMAHFEPGVIATIIRSECAQCGAQEADYALPGVRDVMETPSCACGSHLYFHRQMVGRLPDGTEVDLLPIFERDILPQIRG